MTVQRSKTPTSFLLERKFRFANITLFSMLAAILLLFSIFMVRHITLKVGKTEAELHSMNAAARISGYIDRETSLVASISSSPFIQDYFADEGNEEKRKACFEALERKLKLLHAGNIYTTIEASKNEISFEEGQDLEKFRPFDKVVRGRFEDKWYFECVGQEKDYVLNVDVDKLLQRKLIWLNHKVFSEDGKLLGVFAIGLQLHQLLEDLFQSYADREVRWFVIDGKGFIQMDSSLNAERRLIFDNKESEYRIADMIPEANFIQDLETLLSKEEYFTEHDPPRIVSLSSKVGGLSYDYAVLSPLKGTDWSVVTCYNAKTLFDISFVYPLLALCGGCIVLYAAGTVMLNHRLLFIPLRLLSQSVQDSSQNTDAVIYGLQRNDEFGLLAVHIQNMRERLQQNSVELYDAYQKARSADFAKSQFLTVMSHELRTPLNGVIGMAELLKIYSLQKEQAEYVEIISESALSLLRLIEDVLDFSEMDLGKTDLKPAVFHWSELIESVDSTIRPRAESQGLRFDVSSTDRLHSEVVGDSRRIRQVLLNLLSNAVKFTQHGQVELKSETTQTVNGEVRIRCSVIDTGIGMTEETLEKLFQPFVQGDGSMTRSFEGTGMGLAISKRLVEMMNGTLTVQSTAGEGSEFIFEIILPLAERSIV